MKKYNYHVTNICEPFESIKAKARRALAKSTIAKSVQPKEKKAKKKEQEQEPRPTQAELALRAIMQNVANESLGQRKAILSNPGQGSSAYQTLRVYRRGEDGKFHPEHGNQYVLYTANGCPDRLGSIAIYGQGALTEGLAIRQTGRIFGLPILRVNFKVSRTLFADITLRG